MQVIKRDGRKVLFNKEKIKNAILAAFKEVDGEESQFAKDKAAEIARYIELSDKEHLDVEEIQDIVESKLMASSRKDVAKSYILYRNERTKNRDNTIDQDLKELFDGTNEYWNTENSNKDATNITVQRDYIAGIASTDMTRRRLLPDDVVKAHDAGIIHFHKDIVA